MRTRTDVGGGNSKEFESPGKQWVVGKACRLVTGAILLAFIFAISLNLWRSRQAPLSTDEGYNLEVVDNLAKKGSYASYGNRRLDAWWSLKSMPLSQMSGERQPRDWFFDPRVTTGPTVLFPLALVWWLLPGNITALRLVMWCFFFLALAAVWFLARRYKAGIPGFVTSAAIFSTLFFGFHPGSLIGEVPATALFLFGVLAASRAQVFLAGLLWGMAVEAKFIFLPGAVAAAMLTALFSRKNLFVKKSFLLIAGFGVPVAFVELYRYWSLGSMAGWLASWQEFMAFSAEQSGWRFLELLPRKWESMKTLGPGLPLALAVGFATLVFLLRPKTAHGAKEAEGSLFISPILMVSGLLLGGTWLLFSAQTSYRQGMPALLVLYPGLMLASSWWEGLTSPERVQPWRARLRTACAWLVCFCTFGSLAGWASRFATFEGWNDGIRGQQAAARALVASGAQAISPLVRWFEPFPVLTGLRMAPCVGPNQAMVVTLWAQAVARKPRDHFRNLCATVIAENRDVLICFPKFTDGPQGAYDLKIRSWGPQKTPVGTVPNPQPTGHGALWFTLAAPLPHKPQLAVFANGQLLGNASWAAGGDWFSAPFPKERVLRPGKLQIDILDICRGTTYNVGTLVIEPRDSGKHSMGRVASYFRSVPSLCVVDAIGECGLSPN